MVPAFSLLATLATLGTAAAVVHPYTAPVLVPVLSTAENQKGFQTFSVQSRLDDQFVSVQHCLPIQLTLKEAKGSMGAAPIFALVDVNTTSLDGSYTIHPLVENKQLRLSLNGTVESRDLVNVTITVPPAWGNELFNATITGKGYFNISLPNSSANAFQLQLSGAGVANFGLSPASLAVNADTNGSFIGNGRLDQVVTVQKSGSGGVYVSAVNGSTSIFQTGKGITAVKSTDTASVVQSGPGAVFLGVGIAADVTYAGGKNSTYIQGTGKSINGTGNAVAAVRYTTTGNGTLVFSGAPGAAYPAISVNGEELTACLNVTKWSNKACNETAVPSIPTGPTPPASRPRCAGTWVLTDSDMCYTNPLQGYQCQTVKPANGGEKFALVLVLFVTAFALIWLNSI